MLLHTTKHKIIYRTFSICPICTFIEPNNSNNSWINSWCIMKDQKIWYVYQCSKHGQQEILYFSNVKFFFRMLKYSPGLLEQKILLPVSKTTNRGMVKGRDKGRTKGGGGVGDIEEVKKRISYESENSNYPFIITYDITKETKKEDLIKLIEKSIIWRIVNEKIDKNTKRKKNFLIKINGKLENLQYLNELVLFLFEKYQQIFKENSILIELPFNKFDRMIKLKNTVLLKSNVYPSVKIYIEKDRENVNLDELKGLFKIMQQIKNIKVVLKICICRPLPNLKELIDLTRKMYKICKFVVIEFERSPNQIKSNFIQKKVHFNVKDLDNNVDTYELVEMIKNWTNGQINENDFYPVSYAAIAEKILQYFGFGNYSLRTSPLCGFATILVNSENFKSVPLSRFLNLQYIFNQMIPILKTTALDVLTFNFFKAKKIQKILMDSIIKQKGMPKNVMEYFTSDDKTKFDKVKQIIDDTQILIVHNNIDLGCCDLGRRSRCSVCYFRDGNTFSDCMKCI